jgi:hypothetical protein
MVKSGNWFTSGGDCSRTFLQTSDRHAISLDGREVGAGLSVAAACIPDPFQEPRFDEAHF